MVPFRSVPFRSVPFRSVPFRSVPFRSVPFVVILAVGACSPPAPPPNPFASSGGATDPSLPGCGSCFVVDRDNPVFRATDFKLRGAESVTRGAQEVSYTNFLIEPVLSMGNVGRGADAHPYLPLFAEPGTLVTYFPGDAYPFEIHGLEAGYAPLGVFANYRDVNNRGFGIPNATFQVQLSPKTILVPFQVVRVMSNETGTVLGQQMNALLAHYSVASYKQLFDDQTPVSVLRKQHPDEPNAGTDYAYLSNGGTTDQIVPSALPDDVWAQCGIQFRMIPCEGMEFGCPDLLTDNATMFPKCDSLTDGHQRALRLLARNVFGVRSSVPLVVATYKVSQNCDGPTLVHATVLGDTVLYAPLSKEGNYQFGLNHELGHVLGISGHPCPNGTGLMCPTMTQLDGTITAESCAGARKGAAAIASAYWGVPISP